MSRHSERVFHGRCGIFYSAINDDSNDSRLTGSTQPKLNEVSRLVARLGGFLARKSDGEPGAEMIWKALTKVHIAAKTVRLWRNDGDA